MTDMDTQRQELAAAFGRTLDPLEAYAPVFEQQEIDPFALFMADILEGKTRSKRTLAAYHSTFRQWKAFMADQGRHPACPSEEHVRAFIRYERDDQGHVADTIKNKLRRLNTAFEYWQEDNAFPHGKDFNPFALARNKENLESDGKKEPPRIPIDKLSEIVEGIHNIRDRAIVVTLLKLGLRATELCNIKLSEVSMNNSLVRDHYPHLGTSPYITEYENAVYIPPNPNSDAPVEGRPGNKSKRPRVLPLDDETRRVIRQWLLIRPDCGEPELFVSQSNHNKLRKNDINRVVKRYFQPEYVETEEFKGVTSHFGRHRFTTFWRVEKDLNRDKIKYMRGDVVGGGSEDAIDTYIHAYFEDIEPIYRDKIFKLGC